MEALVPSQVTKWLHGMPEATVSLPRSVGSAAKDSAEIMLMVPNVRRSIALRAENHAVKPPWQQCFNWWRVGAPILAAATGIVAHDALVLSGEGLGWCQWTDCDLDDDDPYPVAAVVFYQGPLANDVKVSGVNQVAGFSVLTRYSDAGLRGTHYVVTHVSPTGVRYGSCTAADIFLFFSDAEIGTSFPTWGWVNLEGEELEAAIVATPKLYELARHISG
jgi:hypothetical protein